MITKEDLPYAMCMGCPVPEEAVEAFCHKVKGRQGLESGNLCLLREINRRQPGILKLAKEMPSAWAPETIQFSLPPTSGGDSIKTRIEREEDNNMFKGTANCPTCEESMDLTSLGWSCAKCKALDEKLKSLEANTVQVKKLLLDMDLDARTIRFYENDIKYGQDMRFYKGIPQNVSFTVEKSGIDYLLKADGYGYGNRGNYGNGALYIYSTRLNEKVKECLETLSKPS